jgi:prepilin-type processing-associated H-X9-DG protein
MDSDVISDQGNNQGDVFTCPSAGIKGGDHHYSCHPVVMPFRTDADDPGRGYPMDVLQNASKTILVADTSQRPAMGGQSDAQFWTVAEAYQEHDPSRGDNNEAIDPGPNEDSDSPPGRAYFRWRHHRGAANFLFADGHVETRRPDQVLKGDLRVPQL